jgi:hypothetical protein
MLIAIIVIVTMLLICIFAPSRKQQEKQFNDTDALYKEQALERISEEWEHLNKTVDDKEELREIVKSIACGESCSRNPSSRYQHVYENERWSFYHDRLSEMYHDHNHSTSERAEAAMDAAESLKDSREER